MADGFNKCLIMGNLAADAELRATQNSSVLNFRVACSESFKDRGGERKERTEYVSCVLWGPRAEALSKILRKGMQVFCEGSLRTETYEKDGEKRYSTKVNITNVILGGRGGGEQGERRTQRAPARNAPPAESPPDDVGGGYGGDDDIPFAFIGAAPERNGVPRTWL